MIIRQIIKSIVIRVLRAGKQDFPAPRQHGNIKPAMIPVFDATEGKYTSHGGAFHGKYREAVLVVIACKRASGICL